MEASANGMRLELYGPYVWPTLLNIMATVASGEMSKEATVQCIAVV